MRVNPVYKRGSMAKLGQQLQAQQQQQAPQTRVERLRQQREEVKFQNLSAEAKKIQEEQFKEKNVERQQTYYEYRPKEYSEKQWNRLTQEQRERALDPYRSGRGLDYYAQKGQLIKIAKTRTVTETIPFTLDTGENSYTNIYNNLSPDLKSFFASPETLKAERSQRIQTNITKVDERIAQSKMRLSEIDQKYQEDKQQLQERWQNKSSKYRSDPGNREDYKQRLKDLENEYDQSKEEERGRLQGLQEGRGQLSGQQDVDFNSIVNYANDLSNYFEQRVVARQENRQAQQKAIKDLAERNAEAQAKGFDFTGTIVESQVNQKTGKETQQGTRYYLGGAQVSGQEFSKKFDVYKRPSGSQLIVAKGTDFSQLSQKQLATLFPLEYEQAKQKKLTEQREEASKISQLSITPTQVPEKSKTIFSTIGSFLGKGLGFASDVLGSVIPDTSLSGSRSLEATTIPEEELKQRREEIKSNTLNLRALGLYSVGSFTGAKPTIIDASIESFKLRRDIAKGGEEAKQLAPVVAVQIDEIGKAQKELTSINDQVTSLNNQIGQGQLSEEKSAEIQKKYEELKVQRAGVYENLASKGVGTKINVSDTGEETITFTSPELEKDYASSAVKEFRTKTSRQKTIATVDVIGQEVLEGALLGYGLGATGVLAKGGVVLSKVPGVTTLVTKFPTATKIGAETLFAGTTIAISSIQGYRTAKEFQQQGLPASEGFLLGAGIPLGKATGFYAGAKIGTKVYTQQVLEKASKGGFTRTIIKEGEIEGKKIKYPAEARGGQTVEAQGRRLSTTAQASQQETRIPGTDIKIKQEGSLTGKYEGSAGGEKGTVITEITKGQAPFAKGAKTEARTFFIKPAGKEQTGIVVISEAKGGVNIDQFRTATKLNDLKVLQEFDNGARLYAIDFGRPIEKVGTTVFVKGASLDDLSKARGILDYNRLFTKFAGEDTLFSVGRTRQLIYEYPQPTGFYDTTTGQEVLAQRFVSVGVTKAGRIDAIKDVLKNSGFLVSEKPQIYSLFANKKGQLALFTTPEVTPPAPTISNIDALVQLQEPSAFVLPGVIKGLAPTITSEIGLKSLLSTSLLAGSSLKGRAQQRVNQKYLQNQLQEFIQLNIQQQSPQERQQIQQAQRTLQQPLLEQPPIEIIPSFPATPTPTPTPLGAIALPDFDLQFFEAVRKKAGRKKSTRDLAYVQDFTSKIVGFAPIEVSEAEAVKLAQKVQTGFEIRAPIIVRKNKDEKRLKKLLNQ